MAWTQSDIDALKSAIATGAREVRYADGRLVVYRTLDEMMRVLASLSAEVSPNTQPPRFSLAEYHRS